MILQTRTGVLGVVQRYARVRFLSAALRTALLAGSATVIQPVCSRQAGRLAHYTGWSAVTSLRILLTSRDLMHKAGLRIDCAFGS